MDEIATMVRPFAGDVWCHAPATEPFRIDALAREDDGLDRWSVPGLRTTYLAGDRSVAVAEYSRHAAVAGADERHVIRLRAEGLTVLDARESDVAGLLGIATPHTLLDRSVTRAATARVRSSGACHGLIVPSVAFLDDPDRWNLVVFCERLGRLESYLAAVGEAGRIQLGD